MSELSPEGQAFRDHLAQMQSDNEYANKVRELRKDCYKCDMEIIDTLSKCKDTTGCSVMGGKKRSKKRSKKSRSRRTTSHRRRSRARR